MISNFRKGADNIFVRILLILIALSFVGVGGAAFIKGNSRGEIVTFSNANSITYEQFKYAKSREIDFLQKQNGINLTEENIAELNLDNTILKKLINISMIDYLAKLYELDVSTNRVISFIKKTPYFNNDKGEFDFSIFKTTFHNSIKKEEEYLASIKQNIISASILNIFLDSFIPPKIMTENIINFMAETRVADIFSMDLEQALKNYNAKLVSQEEMQEFYNKNKTMFQQPEQRSFEYLKADKNFIQKKLNFSDKDLKIYFEDNIDEFSTRNFQDVKSEIKEIFAKEKTEELVSELAKNFEEDVASGLSINEIANKYNLELFIINDMTLATINSSENSDLIEMADTIFDMAKDELSYPIEVQDKSEILLVNLTNIKPSRELNLEEVENDIKSIIEKRNIALHNIEILEGFKNALKQGNATKHSAIKLIANKPISRADLPIENTLPTSLLKELFDLKTNESTSISSDGKYAYFALVKEVKNNNNIAKKIRENSQDHFKEVIKEGVLQELINYLTIKNNMKIKMINEEQN
ncbi:MAG: hypothetical protein EKK61_04385 [Rickettsiales bacterium]|nr:MAG: hypothetical protein EKK61_04385 [Rickettsiales bacterium]